ncbi:hypothetical protein EV177_005197, partial [Coemansia sp. RSA 1804]
MIYQFENKAFGAAQSSQEYIMLLNNHIMEMSQKVKSFTANPGANVPSATGAGQSAGLTNRATMLAQPSQFNQQNPVPPHAQLQPHSQAQTQQPSLSQVQQLAQAQAQAQAQIQAQTQAQTQTQASAQGGAAGARSTIDLIR